MGKMAGIIKWKRLQDKLKRAVKVRRKVILALKMDLKTIIPEKKK